jgi:hypothetical protein
MGCGLDSTVQIETSYDSTRIFGLLKKWEFIVCLSEGGLLRRVLHHGVS